jgi:hypothetical protein
MALNQSENGKNPQRSMESLPYDFQRGMRQNNQGLTSTQTSNNHTPHDKDTVVHYPDYRTQDLYEGKDGGGALQNPEQSQNGFYRHVPHEVVTGNSHKKALPNEVHGVRIKIEGEDNRPSSTSGRLEGRSRRANPSDWGVPEGYTALTPEPQLAIIPYVKREESDSDGEKGRKSRKSKNKKSRKTHSDSERESSDDESISSITSIRKEDHNSLYNIFQRMTCSQQYTNSLAILKQLLCKKSDFLEVKRGSRGQRHHVRFADYFPSNFTGNAKQLKRYLQRVLQYSALSTSDDQTRADVVADGLGLSATSAVELEQAARVPLPGFSRDYGEDKVSQKKRLLDILLTFVILFHQEEQTLALQDLKLKGPMFTGLTKLFHLVNTGSTSLPAKLIEEYLTRAIARAENGEGVALLKAFQSQLRMMKRLETSWQHNDADHRLLLFNCCDTLAAEDNGITLPPSSTHQSAKGGGKRHEANYAFQSESSYQRDDWNPYEGLMEEYTALAITPQPYGDRKDRREKDNKDTREGTFSAKFCSAPCACCGAKDHPMLSPIRTPEGAPLNCNYVCPAALCENWQEERVKRNVNRFQPCPKKFAMMCRNDAKRAHEAIVDYEKVGSGQYRRAPDRAKFRTDVLRFCEAPASRADFPQRTRAVGFTKGVEECNSGRVSKLGRGTNGYMASAGLPIIKDDSERTIVTALQANGRTTTPQHVSYSALHLLLATHVGPASLQDIESTKSGDAELTTHRTTEDSVSTVEGGRGGRIRYRMPYGAEYIVPYPEICGRILADTGSTTTLINREFAQRMGLIISSTGSELVLRDVNNGETVLNDYCYLRLTLTTVLGEKITIVILAHCANDLSHDILLGTRDLEKYRISVVSHRGEAHIMVGNRVEVLPMLDGTQVSHLQYRLAKVKDEC